MLGRPNCWAPVFIMICAGAWLKASVTSDFTIVMTSTMVARWGRSCEISVALFPYLPKWNFGPSSFELGLMNAARYPLMSSGGGSVPLNFVSCGLWSKSSRWLGAPAMKR